ncbi:hypothetical protein I302_106089 [Kwoniella bestiolae CBS 10118]|uniref:Type 1 phosphatases regulator n=1 Tax=Kwoniella bestiolae CBS 10118 TaxID=1296100 RepID=A0A1B9G301_9TREE|nr:type 1 phosphatase regulator YPI1 [Kwoniella bestiolae CBS 10118]OCF25396.1 type 1 phosphatase regulator YPI1 [Kwoniella bestiolae CBS 10118]
MSTQPRQPTQPTQTQVEAGPSTTPTPTEQPPAGVLKLRGGPLKKQRVVWSDETVDNEGMGKKKSKICCIYHKPKAFDESSDESSCSSSDEDHSPRQSKSHRKSNGKAQKQKSRDGGDGGVEELSDSQSSESDGGAGDGRARPSRKPKKQHHHSHDCDHHGKGRVNKYDIQPKPSDGASGPQN